MSEFKLREASTSDLDALLPIYMDDSVNRFLNFEILTKDEFKNIFDELLASGELFVFEKNNQVVATCIVMRHKRRCAHVATLGTLATHPQFHGQGIGTQFMQQLFKKLRDDGISRIELYVESDNLNAQHFYKKLGFQLEGVLKDYFKRPCEEQYVDEYLMAIIFK